MKTIKLFTQLIFCCFLISTSSLIGQQTEISTNSDTDISNGNGPHLLLLESGDGGGMGQDGWTRLWFKNSTTDDRWSFLARPHPSMDNDGILTSPLVMAYNGTQMFGFGSDGTLRINKQYTLPNMDGNTDEVLTTDGNGNVTWAAPGSGSNGPTTIRQVIHAADLNPGKDAEDLVILSTAVYFDSSPYNPRLRYSLPVPVGATLNLVRVVALDNDATKKINIKIMTNDTNPGSAGSASTYNLYTTDTGSGLYQAFDYPLTPTIGTTNSPDQVYYLDIGAALNSNTATNWPGNDLSISKIIIEYTMP